MTPQLLASSDTGTSSTDGITRDTTPTYKVAAPANAIVTLYANGVQVGQATANNGPVFITTTALSAGNYQMTATVEDVAGNVSAAAAPVMLVVSTSPPATPTLGLDAASQSTPGQTTQTNLQSVNLTGMTTAGAFVSLFRQWDPNTAIAQTQADASGHFTFDGITLAAGSQAFIVVASNPAGNSSSLTQTITTTAADTKAPVITAALANDTGISSTDSITSDPTITGLADDPSGVMKFQVSVDGGAMTDATSFLTGEGFTLTAADLAMLNGGTAISNGPHTIALQATDSLGNQSSVYHVFFDLESTRPLPPTSVQLLASDLTGTSGTITKDRSLTVEMSAASGTIVTLYMNGVQVGQQTAMSVPLQFAVPGSLADGQYIFSATAETVSGLISPFSTPLTVTVDNTPPVVSSFGLDAGFSSPAFGQNVTVLPTVRLNGQTEPGATVELMETGALTTADSSGNFSFYPVNLPTLAAYTFTAKATDTAGNTTTVAKTFTRVDNTLPSNLLPPDVTVNVSGTTARVSDTVSISVVTATHDGKALASEVLLINGSPVALSTAGTATLSSLTPGVFSVVADAFDAEGNEGQATQTVIFLTPPTGSPPPVAGFNETQVTPVVTMPTAIMGTASSTDFLQYTLQYSVEGQNQWTTFATGTAPVSNGTLGTIDPTMMDNGFYDVRLTVLDSSGQVTTADEIYQVDGQAKIGNFTLSFQDINIPESGIDLSATRTYDSRQKNTSGDFGYGWSLSTTQYSVETSSVLGAGFIQTETQQPATQINPLGGLGSLPGLGGFGGLPGVGLPPGLGNRPATIQYSFQNTQNDYVTIYLPNGTAEKFLMGFTGVTYTIAAPPLAQTSIFFVPVPYSGTTGSLVAMTNNNVIVSPAQVGPVTFIDQSTGQVYNPTTWKYTAADGTVYIISKANGLESVTDSSGNSTTFSADGEISSDGASLTFTRDSQNRITAITDPMGKSITYQYDFYGDLVSVTDRDGNVTRFTYDTDHLLLHVYDPLGRQGVRTEYDSSGRVTEIINAMGAAVTFSNDLPDRVETSVDALGNSTTSVYDTEGNIVEQIDPTGTTTTSTYNALNEVLTQTVTFTDGTAETTTNTYDANGNLLSTTDPAGNVTSYTYDSSGNVLTETDPEGNTSTKQYNATGKVTQVVDAAGNKATIGYSSTGEVSSILQGPGMGFVISYNADGSVSATAGNASLPQVRVNNADGNPISSSTLWTDPTDPSDQQTLNTTYKYDSNGNIIGVTLPSGASTSTKVNADGTVASAVDELGNTTSFKYNPSGQVVESTTGGGAVIQTVYDLLGRPIYVTDPFDPSSAILPNGTYTQYDVLGRVVETQRLSGLRIEIMTTAAGNSYSSFVSDTGILSTETTVYAPNGQIQSTTSSGGGTTTYEYNSLGQETAVVDALGNRTTYAYDQYGNMVLMTDPLGNQTHYQYDGLGNLTKTTLADGSVVQDSYDSEGNIVSETDSLGNTTQYVFGPYSELDEVILPAVPDPNNGGLLTHPTYSYVYDSTGDLLQVTDPMGNVTKYTYDAYGDQLTQTNPDGETTQNVYNGLGQLFRTIDYDGHVTQYVYNSQGEQSQVEYFQNLTQANSGTPSYNISYTYTGLGQLSTVDDPRIGLTTYHYNAEGEVTEVDNPEDVINYTYDPATDNVLAISTNSTTLQYAYDALGDLTSTTAVELERSNFSEPAEDELHVHGDGIAAVRNSSQRRQGQLLVRRRWQLDAGDHARRGRRSSQRIRLCRRLQ